MGIGTYEAYRERISKMKPNVYLHGEKVDRNGDWVEGGCYVMKQCYDIANNPEKAVGTKEMTRAIIDRI